MRTLFGAHRAPLQFLNGLPGGLLAVEEFALAQRLDVVDQRPRRGARRAVLAEYLVEEPADFVLFESHKKAATGSPPPGGKSCSQKRLQKAAAVPRQPGPGSQESEIEPATTIGPAYSANAGGTARGEQATGGRIRPHRIARAISACRKSSMLAKTTQPITTGRRVPCVPIRSSWRCATPVAYGPAFSMLKPISSTPMPCFTCAKANGPWPRLFFKSSPVTLRSAPVAEARS